MTRVAWHQGMARRSRASMLGVHARAAWGGWRERRAFDDIHAFCAFVGYARSGSTLLGALLDAHPDCVIANELDAFAALREGVRRRALFHMLVTNSAAFARDGCAWTGYAYKVPGGHQGRFRHLRVIGDKKAAVSTRRVVANPWLLDRLRTVVGAPLRLIHVVRNPFDHVGARWRHAPSVPVDVVLGRLLALYDAMERVRALVDPSELLEVHHERLVANPARELSRCREFLGLADEPHWLEAAASLVLPRPRGGRDLVEWTAPRRATLAARIERHGFLRPYAR